MTAEQPQFLRASLERLSMSLETPCVPGEVEEWVRPVLQAVDGAGEALRKQIATNHKEHYASIVEEDTEMFRQVAKLKEADQKLLCSFESLAVRCRKLLEKAPRIEPDELKVREDMDGLVHEGLAFVVACQQQEIAVRSCFQEAFTRERGVGD